MAPPEPLWQSHQFQDDYHATSKCFADFDIPCTNASKVIAALQPRSTGFERRQTQHRAPGSEGQTGTIEQRVRCQSVPAAPNIANQETNQMMMKPVAVQNQDCLATQLKTLMEASGFAYLVTRAEAWVLEMGAAFLCEILQEFSAFADDLGMHPDDKEARQNLFQAIQHEAQSNIDATDVQLPKPQDLAPLKRTDGTARQASKAATALTEAVQPMLTAPRTLSQLQNAAGKLVRGGQGKGIAATTHRRQNRRLPALQAIPEERPEDIAEAAEDESAPNHQVAEVHSQAALFRTDAPQLNIDPRSPLAKEVNFALLDAGLAHCGSKATAWCKDMGAAFVTEILEEFDDFANCLGLPVAPDPARAVLVATLSQRLQVPSASPRHAPWQQPLAVSCM